MRARVAIVGGGFAGLSAALHLVRAGVDVTLFEAGTVGCEASGRNTGMLGPGAIAPITSLVDRHGPDGARAIFQATLDAVESALELIQAEGLACDLEVTGQLLVARTGRQAAFVESQARAFQELGFDVEWLDRDALATRIASDSFRGGLRHPRAANLDPLRLCHELARVCRARGVVIREQTPVRSVAAGRLELASGESVLADRVVLATNAFTSRLGVLRGRVTPLSTHVVLTEPLGERVRALGWPGREGVVDARRFFSYFRLTADDRLRWGGGAPLHRRAEDPATYATIAAEIESVFPSLQGVRIEKQWSGVMGFTLDRTPIVGPLAEEPAILHTGAW